jgi:hypothetical protein
MEVASVRGCASFLRWRFLVFCFFCLLCCLPAPSSFAYTHKGSSAFFSSHVTTQSNLDARRLIHCICYHTKFNLFQTLLNAPSIL